MTDAELAAILFLRDNTQRVVLVEMDYQYENAGAPATGTVYLSNNPLFASPANVIIGAGDPTIHPYIDCITAIPDYARSLSGPLLGTHSSSLGTLDLDNADGALDYLLNLFVDGSEVRFTMRDLVTANATLLMFKCMAVKVTAPAMGKISIQLKDTGMLLNQSIGGTIRIGGTGPDADKWRPVNFGLVRQVPCLVVDPTNLVYCHSYTGAGMAVSSGSFAMTVRDRGVSVSFTNNGDGTFTLLASPAGTITADVLYVIPAPGNEWRCVSDAMATLVAPYTSSYVGPGPTFSVHPGPAVGAWLAAGGEDYQVGISIPDRRNVLDLLADICDSGLCFWAVTRLGAFTFGRLRPNYIAGLGLTAAHTIQEDDLIDNDFQLDELPTQYYQLQATMSRNWLVETDLATSLTPTQHAQFTRTGLYVLQNLGVGTDYASAPQSYNKTLVQSPTIDTLLSGFDDTTDPALLQLWMETRRAMTLPWQKVASCTVGIEFYDVEIGDPITVKIPRFGYDAGVDFQCISTTIKLPNKVALKMVRRDVQAPYAGRTTVPPPNPPFFLDQLTAFKILQQGGSGNNVH